MVTTKPKRKYSPGKYRRYLEQKVTYLKETNSHFLTAYEEMKKLNEILIAKLNYKNQEDMCA